MSGKVQARGRARPRSRADGQVMSVVFHDPGQRPKVPGQPARNRRLSRAVEVQEAVKEIIVQRGLTAGDPLPTESELMAELGIGRNSVREALKVLQAVG